MRNIVVQGASVGASLGVECQPVTLTYGRFILTDDSFKKTNRGASEPQNPKDLRHIYDSQQRVQFGEGDVLLLLDISMHLPIWPAVMRAKAQGTKVGVLVYDLIPVSHPHYFMEHMVTSYRTWMETVLKHADFLIGISEFVCDEIRRFASQWGYDPEKITCAPIPLAAELDGERSSGAVRGMITDAFESSESFYLVVGTIEPRKNHKLVLDAFEHVWRKCPDARLCIVGMVGWSSEELVQRIRQHPRYSDTLIVCNDASDAELEYIYRHSSALIAPSVVEGFGLPLVEALQRGLPVLANDTTIHREVGGPFCSYFDSNDAMSLASMIMEIEESGKMPQVRDPAERDSPTWRESCEALIKESLTLCSSPVSS